MKTLKELNEFRAIKVLAISKIMTDKGEQIEPADLATMGTLKDEISNIDNQIVAINLQRGVALTAVKPADEVMVDNVKKLGESFVAHLRGQIDYKEYEKVVATMQSGTTGSGLELVPPEYMKIILEKIKEYGTIFGDVDIIETANNGELTIPTVDDTANVGAWTDEGGAIALIDFDTGKKTMNAHKVTAAVPVSNEFLEDAFFDIGTYVANLLGVRISRAIETSFINGDGVKKPMGIIADTSTKDVTSISIDAVEHADAVALIKALQPSSRKGAVFYASDEFMIWMSEQLDTTGRPLYQSSGVATVADEIKYSIGGYAVRPNYELGSLVGGDVPLIFGNPKYYMARMIRGLKIQSSDQLKILDDQTVFVATSRLDGKMITQNDGFSKLTVRTV